MDPKKQAEGWQSRLTRSVNSAICFALAYILLTYLYWVVTGLAAKTVKLDSFVYCYGIKFILNNHAWDKMKVTLVFGAGPVFSLCAGLFCYFLYKMLRTIRTTFNVFLIWCYVIGTGIFISQLFIAAVGMHSYNSLSLYQGFAVVMAWWRIPVFLVYLLDIPVIILALYFSVNCARPFLLLTSSFRKVNSQSRRKKYFFEIAIAPFLLGVFIAAATTFPKSRIGRNLFILMMSRHAIYVVVIAAILAVAWLALAYIELLKSEVLRYKTLETPSIVFILLLLVATAYIYITYRGIYLSSA